MSCAEIDHPEWDIRPYLRTDQSRLGIFNSALYNYDDLCAPVYSRIRLPWETYSPVIFYD
jgi:hypothetical protein